MIDELTIATSVLAAFTGALVIVTALYAYYTKQQVKLLKIGHELAKPDIAVKALAAFGEVVPALITKSGIEDKIKELELDKA
jgi:hypothetical protein